MKPTPAEILKGKPRRYNARTPPIAENGTAVNMRSAYFTELNAKKSKTKMSNKATGTAIASLCLASTRFSNCPP
jgi:hypothetical protein